jgi:Fe-S-cluster-containing dehydrogenase component
LAFDISALKEREGSMPQKKLVVGPEKCTGCRLCESVCSLFHEQKLDLTLSRIQIDPLEENSFRPKVCLQCQTCPPSEICPNEAFQWDEKKGVVEVLKERCDGCGLCISQCPFSSVFERDGGVIVCDVCEGNPKCVEVCQKQAIQFI